MILERNPKKIKVLGHWLKFEDDGYPFVWAKDLRKGAAESLVLTEHTIGTYAWRLGWWCELGDTILDVSVAGSSVKDVEEKLQKKIEEVVKASAPLAGYEVQG